MIKLVRTNSDNKDFIKLVKHLDHDLAKRDGDDYSFYTQYNKIDKIKQVIVAYNSSNVALGCGALKHYSAREVEIKRMYTSPESRSKGIANKIITELEKWATELCYTKCILETGIKQLEAIHLYEKCGYIITPNYGQYAKTKNSICFKKNIITQKKTPFTNSYGVFTYGIFKYNLLFFRII